MSKLAAKSEESFNIVSLDSNSAMLVYWKPTTLLVTVLELLVHQAGGETHLRADLARPGMILAYHDATCSELYTGSIGWAGGSSGFEDCNVNENAGCTHFPQISATTYAKRVCSGDSSGISVDISTRTVEYHGRRKKGM